MKPIDILIGRNGRNDLLGIQMHRQGHLDENARNSRVGIQALDQIHQVILRGGGRKLVILRCYTALLAILKLRTNVGSGSLIIANQHDREMGMNAAFNKLGHIYCRLLAHASSQSLSVNYRRHV